MNKVTETAKKESPTEQAKRYRLLWQANAHEVSRLSSTVKLQEELVRRLEREVDKWEKRFDLLLDRK